MELLVRDLEFLELTLASRETTDDTEGDLNVGGLWFSLIESLTLCLSTNESSLLFCGSEIVNGLRSNASALCCGVYAFALASEADECEKNKSSDGEANPYFELSS